MSTALITGASAGLGAQFARRLAAEHADLVLVARDDARLNRLAADLCRSYDVTVEPLVADLATDEGCAVVERRLAAGGIDLLINNAGIGVAGSFAHRDLAASDRLTRLNVLAVMRLTHAALRTMLPRGKGDVLNVSSVSGFTPGVRDATYAASKAWVAVFSESLHEQLRDTGVRVLAVCPGFVHTEFHQRAGLDMTRVPDQLWTDPQLVVREALHALRRGRAVAVPGLHYKLIVAGARYLPRVVVRRVTAAAARRTS